MPVLPVTVVVLVVGAVALARRADIRLVLIAAAVALFALHATNVGAAHRLDAFTQVFVEFAKGMTNPQAIVSQTSTVSVVGPVIIPLVLAAGFSRVTAGALLLLGGSMGGELLNPAAVEVNAIKAFTGSEATDVIAHLLPYNLLASGTALV